jgi:hypothetical protein
MLLFINLFSDTAQTAVAYQEHRAIATKCSDLLDNMLLNPGSPSDWGKTNSDPIGFGLQDPEFTQYQISPFSQMRLAPSNSDPVRYDKTGTYYSNLTMGIGNSLMVPYSQKLDYSLAQELLGINGTYGFQLTLTPTITFNIAEIEGENLTFSLSVMGSGFPLAEATVNYCLLLVSLATTEEEYPSYRLAYGDVTVDEQGLGTVVTSEPDVNQCYAFIAYAHLGGVLGVGYNDRISAQDQHVIPMIRDFAEPSILLAHSYDIDSVSPPSSSLQYNATFVLVAADFTLREMDLASPNSTGIVTSGLGNPYINVTIPPTPGILVVTYQEVGNATAGGVAIMPWGISSLSFPVTFGGDPLRQEWVATDMRLVTINRVSYQAKLSLWSTQARQVIG